MSGRVFVVAIQRRLLNLVVMGLNALNGRNKLLDWLVFGRFNCLE